MLSIGFCKDKDKSAKAVEKMEQEIKEILKEIKKLKTAANVEEPGPSSSSRSTHSSSHRSRGSDDLILIIHKLSLKKEILMEDFVEQYKIPFYSPVKKDDGNFLLIIMPEKHASSFRDMLFFDGYAKIVKHSQFVLNQNLKSDLDKDQLAKSVKDELSKIFEW